MNVICINKDKIGVYKVGECYTYDLSDFIPGGIKFYAVYLGRYDGCNKLVAYATKEFLDKNFVSLFAYNMELRYVDQMFDFIMDFGNKLNIKS